MTLLKLLPFTLLLVLIFPITNYSQEYLGDDLSFFQKKAKLYDAWLEAKGLGDLLRVDEVKLTHNNLNLAMVLSLRVDSPDEVANTWTSLVRNFETKNPNLKLGEYLYEAFIRMMEIPSDQGNIQIYAPDPKKSPPYDICFYVWYWEKNGKVQDESRVNACKGPQEVIVEVDLPMVQRVSSSSSAVSIVDEIDARTVFNQVMDYVYKRYEGRGLTADTPSRIQDIKQDDYRLKFTVTDIRREVLSDGKRTFWCKLMNDWFANCDDVRRERLEFDLTYRKTKNGYKLEGQLTGKFGSGVFKPRKSGWMDMEPDFLEDYLSPYINRFQLDLKTYLESRK